VMGLHLTLHVVRHRSVVVLEGEVVICKYIYSNQQWISITLLPDNGDRDSLQNRLLSELIAQK
jgi:hypothetical protein